MAKKRDLDSEVNLISFISLLAVMICSLLLSVAWVQIGSMNVKQAIGGQPQEETETKPALWARFDNKNHLLLEVQDSSRIPKKFQKIQLANEAGKINFTVLQKHIETLRGFDPSLRMVLIQPQAETVYEDLIALMDHFKKWGLTDLGVSPL